MVSARLLAGALALLAAKGVNAGACRPSSSVSVSTDTPTTSEDVSTTTTGPASTDSTSTTFLVVTTTSEAVVEDSTTTSAASSSTTTAAAEPAGDSCTVDADCLISVDALCVLGLCNCVDAVCTSQSEVQECTTNAQCDAGAFCSGGVCIDIVSCSGATDCVANLDACTLPGVCQCVNGICNLS
ncbi:hypothetical protein AK830_g6694 [Neonectria ditissima]|uniref:Extracellular membrane protein CFEM domain-containing protein n=1 Tax=Neonectria ditissima TaxID=78410 RepID=A0A0N8H6T4_9HYPO|nr:hypothetical protein AK830_g6694 [Neonectria ditissima]